MARSYSSYPGGGDVFLGPSNVRRRSPKLETGPGSDFDVTALGTQAALDAAGTGIGQWMDRIASRMSGDAPARWMKSLASPKNLARGAALTAGIPIVLELASDRPLDEKGARAVGSLAGLPAAALGMALGGGPNPVGLALAALFAAGGSQAGSALAEGGLNFLKGGPEGAAARAAIKQAETQAKISDTLLPAAQRRMQAVTDAKLAEAQAMAPLINDQRLRERLAQQAADIQNSYLLDQLQRSQNIFG